MIGFEVKDAVAIEDHPSMGTDDQQKTADPAMLPAHPLPAVGKKQPCLLIRLRRADV